MLRQIQVPRIPASQKCFEKAPDGSEGKYIYNDGDFCKHIQLVVCCDYIEDCDWCVFGPRHRLIFLKKLTDTRRYALLDDESKPIYARDLPYDKDADPYMEEV